MNRRRKLGWLGVAGILALLLGSGLIAIVTDSITSPGNTLESTYTPPQNVQAKFVPDGATTCSTGTYSDGPLTAYVSAATIDFTPSFYEIPGLQHICVKNAGIEAGKLFFSFSNIADTEIGVCGASESGAGGDTTCTDGAAGELSPLVKAALGPAFTPMASGCTDTAGGSGSWPPQFFPTLTTPREAVASIAPGSECILAFRIVTDSSTPQTARAKADTDRVQWDITFTLQEITG